MNAPERDTALDDGQGSSPPGTGLASTDVGGSLVRSEERLRVGTEWVSAGSARLEKYTVTETRTITVQVIRERVRLITTGADEQSTAVDDPGADGAAPAGAATASSGWLVLTEEQVVVSKQPVPVERVRLDTFLTIEQQDVTAQVRSERIELVADPGVITHESASSA